MSDFKVDDIAQHQALVGSGMPPLRVLQVRSDRELYVLEINTAVYFTASPGELVRLNKFRRGDLVVRRSEKNPVVHKVIRFEYNPLSREIAYHLRRQDSQTSFYVVFERFLEPFVYPTLKDLKIGDSVKRVSHEAAWVGPSVGHCGVVKAFTPYFLVVQFPGLDGHSGSPYVKNGTRDHWYVAYVNPDYAPHYTKSPSGSDDYPEPPINVDEADPHTFGHEAWARAVELAASVLDDQYSDLNETKSNLRLYADAIYQIMEEGPSV